MTIAQRMRPTSRLMFGIILLAAMLLIAACQPIVDPALLEAQASGEAEGAASAEALFEVEPAKATIDASSLRVREGPSDDYELVAGIKEGETYDVLAMTSDGAWIQLAVESAPDGQGWVSTEFVTLEGDITNIATVPAEGTEATEAEADTAPAEAAAADEGAEADETAQADTALNAVGEALIQTPLPLRVRSAPTDTEDNKIGSVYNLEKYPVLGISEDGLWVQIDVPDLSDSGGWIWWENVVMSGEIADEFAALTANAETDTEESEAAEPEAADADAADTAEADAAEADAVGIRRSRRS